MRRLLHTGYVRQSGERHAPDRVRVVAVEKGLMAELEPPGTYRPQYRVRWRGIVRVLNHFPWLKGSLAEMVRRTLRHVFEPSLVTTERVVEYPFVFQNLKGVVGPILDIGCCSSRVPIALASRGFPIVGLDFNRYPYSHPNLLALQADALRIPVVSASVYAVLAVSVIEHLGVGHYGDPLANTGDREAVKEIARVLKPDGRALITLPFGRSMTDNFQRVYDSSRLGELLAPLEPIRTEFAWSRSGLWSPCTEEQAASVDWKGSARAVAMIVAIPKTMVIDDRRH